jgi:hypothetical protein
MQWMRCNAEKRGTLTQGRHRRAPSVLTRIQTPPNPETKFAHQYMLAPSPDAKPCQPPPPHTHTPSPRPSSSFGAHSPLRACAKRHPLSSGGCGSARASQLPTQRRPTFYSHHPCDFISRSPGRPRFRHGAGLHFILIILRGAFHPHSGLITLI